MKLADLIDRLSEIQNSGKYDDLVVTVMNEGSIQLEHAITDIAVASYKIILIGKEVE